MRSHVICLGLLVYTAVDLDAAFVAPTSSARTMGRFAGLQACRYGPVDSVDSIIESFLHGEGCVCCAQPNSFTLSPREARVKGPLRALFTSGAMATATGPALADDEVVVKVVTEEATTPAKQEQATAPVEEAPDAPVEEPAPTPAEESIPAPAEPPVPVTDDTPAKEEANDAPAPAPVDAAKEEPAEVVTTTDGEPEVATPVEEEPPPTPSPEASKPEKTFMTSLAEYFPSAMPTPDVASKVDKALGNRNFSKLNTIFGTSQCPDEINTKPNRSLSTLLQQSLTDVNGVFTLGGLAGLPYMGVTGMKDFLSHTPSGGKVVLLFGPHVGITDVGIVGKVERLGFQKPCASCDTTMEAFRILEAQAANGGEAKFPKDSDKREEYIVAKFRKALASKNHQKIAPEATPAFLTLTMFDMIEEIVMKELNACFKDHDSWIGIEEIVLLGGITINRGQIRGSIEPREDFFQPLVYRSYVKENYGALAQPKDLYKDTFGERPKPFYA